MIGISKAELFEYYKSYCRRKEIECTSVPSCSFRQYLRVSIYIDNAMNERGFQNLKEEDMDKFIPKHCKVQFIFGETDTMSVNRFVKANIQEASRIMQSPFVYFVHQQGLKMSDVLLNRLHKGKIMNNSLMYVTAELKDESVTDVLERTANGNGYIKTAESTAIRFRDLLTGKENVIVAEIPFVFPCSMVKEIQIAERGNGTAVEITDEAPEVLLESTKRFMRILKAVKRSD